MDEDQKIISLLAKNESSIANLYEKFSEIFPDKDFWKSLVKDERIHYQWLDTLSHQTKEKNILIEHDRFTQDSIITMIEYIQKLNSEESYSLIKALSLALDLEKSLIESKFFDIFKTDNLEALKILSDLSKMTKEHITKIQEEFDKVKVESDITS